MFKTIRTNRNEIFGIFLALLVIFAGLYYGKTYFPPLAYALSFAYYLGIAAFVFFTPWFVMRITLPNTMGRFVNEWFEAAWFALGKPDSFLVDKSGRLLNKGERSESDQDPNFVRHAGDLKSQLKITLVVYAVLVVAGSIIALAAFSQGISIPVLGGR